MLRAESSFISDINFDVILQDIEFKQGHLTAQARVLYQISDICGGQSDCETVFSPNTFALPCRYRSTDASSTFCSFHSLKRAKSLTLPKSNHFPEFKDH